ncbi:MAG: VWA domain-containing protein [Pseudomonadota bacterium]|nr:VWA domain-containing protein [Pseudomonadota bacterium]
MKWESNSIRQRLDVRARCLFAALLLLGWALMRPSMLWQRDVFNTIFVIDISQSMNTLDYQMGEHKVSRLQVVKNTVSNSLGQVPCGSKVGLAIFTEYRSFLLLAPIEVCANYAELSSSIDHISGKMAWAGGSEIAKGLNWGLKMVLSVEPKPTLVFFTDGHEAPPISLYNRPRIDVKAGEVQGLLVGVGGDELTPIPKFDPDGHYLGYWNAAEVSQTDLYSQGRGGSVAGEKMVNDGPLPPPKARTEHLSSLKEAYLQQLAGETGLGYARLTLPANLANLLSEAKMGQQHRISTPISWFPALLALTSLVICYLWRSR